MWRYDGSPKEGIAEVRIMKSRLNVLIILCGLLAGSISAATPDFYAGFRHLPATVSLYHYKVPEKVLMAQVQAAMQKVMQEGATKVTQANKSGNHGTVSVTTSVFVLPQLYLFDNRGREIFARTAVSNDLAVQLDHAFSSPVPLRNAKQLRAWLEPLVPDGNFPIYKPQSAEKFTVLEYWAPWCEYCFVERDQLVAYFDKHKDLHVTWITVDADVTQVAGTQPKTSQ